MLLLYTVVVLTAEIPAVQHYFAQRVAAALADELQTRVSIGKVTLGLFNRVILHDVVLYDRSDRVMLQGKRLSAKVEVRSVFVGKVNIRTLELIELQATLYKRREAEAPNFQFVLDTFTSKDSTNKKSLNLRINSLIVRRAKVSYDAYDKPLKADGRLDLSHLRVSDMNANVSLKALQSDSLHLRIRDVSLREQSGVEVRQLAFLAVLGERRGLVTNFKLRLPQTQVAFDTLSIGYAKPLTLTPEGIEHVRLRLRDTYVSPADLAAVLPDLRTLRQHYHLHATLEVNRHTARLLNVQLREASGLLNVVTTVTATDWKSPRRIIRAQVDEAHVSATMGSLLHRTRAGRGLSKLPFTLGSLRFSGRLSVYKDNYHAEGTWQTALGQMFMRLGFFAHKNFEVQLASPDLNLKALTSRADLGRAALEVKGSGSIEKGKERVKLTGIIPRIDYNGYRYQDLRIDGQWQPEAVQCHVQLSDPNVRLQLQAKADRLQQAHKAIALSAQVSRLVPGALRLTQRYGSAAFSGAFSLQAQGTTLNDLVADVRLQHFQMTSADQPPYHLAELTFKAGFEQGRHVMRLNSDFMTAEVSGHLEPRHLAESFLNVVGQHVPSLDFTQGNVRHNDFVFNLKVVKSDFFERMLRLPVHLSAPLSLHGHLSDKTKGVSLSGAAEDLVVGGQRLRQTRLFGRSHDDNTQLLVQTVRMTDKANTQVVIEVRGEHDRVRSEVQWANIDKTDYKGTLSAVTDFVNSPTEGKTAVTQLLPADIVIFDSLWHLSPSQIRVSKRGVAIDRFRIAHADQFIALNGGYGGSQADTLSVELSRINLPYVFDLLNFHPVDFAGHVSGQVLVAKGSRGLDLSGRIAVDEFAFNDTVMGDMTAHARWNPAEKQIDLEADIVRAPDSRTYAKGYISPAKDGLDLMFRSYRSPVGFLGRFLKDIFSDLRGHGTGWTRLWGRFADLNLEGEQVVDVKAVANALGTEYALRGDTVKLSQGSIRFDDCTVTDVYGHRGRVSGQILHDHLRNMRYDFRIKADTLLCYDFPAGVSDQPFWGKIVASGTAHLYGKPGLIEADIQAQPLRPTVLTYNASKPTEVSDDRLLVFNDVTHRPLRDKQPLTASVTPPHEQQKRGLSDIKSDLYLNFTIQATPAAALEVIMDEKTGDNILLHGLGDLKAAFHNKGKFQLFGTYSVVDGTYKMSIQDLIHKEFKFRPGGTLTFRGDAYDGDLQLTASYVLPSVALSDLGTQQTLSGNNTKVDCILNINGKVGRPVVNFDLDMPSVNENDRQIIRSYINTEEERNLQALYLLSVGRFYNVSGTETATATGTATTAQSQSTTAVNSFLSSTLSAQVNSVLGSAINSNSWSFGTNFVTGTEGWNDMEVDGLFSGRLLDDRLVFDGIVGYRENLYNANATNFVGDFNLRWFLTKRGNVSMKAYSETNDRYFTKSSLTTQGVGIVVTRDFTRIRDFWGKRKQRPTPTAADSIKRK